MNSITMMIDEHIHILNHSEDRNGFLRELGHAGINGGLIISLPPPAFPAVAPSAPSLDRMNNVLFWCDTMENLYPFYWVDPMEDDAADQIAMAVDMGAMGFKVICDRYFPGDKRPMEIFSIITKGIGTQIRRSVS